MIRFTTSNSTTTIVKLNEDAMDEKLAPMVYTLGQDMLGGFFLSHTKTHFEIPKLYGNVEERTERILNTYNDREKSTGVMLTGDKGSGKSLLSMHLANTCIEKGMPVILINSPFRGDGFNSFMNDIGECVVFFDEFGKTYYNSADDINDQDSLLTFFDGTMSSKRLTVLTENKTNMIDEFIKERPGRMFYHFEYGKLDEITIREVCTDILKTDKVEGIVELARRVHSFSFDILIAIINESNRYPNDSIISISEVLNVPAADNFLFEFEVVKLEHISTNEEVFVLNPILDSLHNYVQYKDDEGTNDDERRSVYLTPREIVYEADGQMIFENEGMRIYVNTIEKPIFKYATYKPGDEL